jgi:serine/threonine protein kinase
MVLGLDVVLAVKTGAFVDRSSLRPPDVALLDLVDGRRTIEEILQLSQTSWFVAMRRLRSLCERGILAPLKGATDGAAAKGSAGATQPGAGVTRAPLRRDERPRTVDLTDVVGKLLIPTAGSPPSALSSATAPGFTPAAPSRGEDLPGNNNGGSDGAAATSPALSSDIQPGPAGSAGAGLAVKLEPSPEVPPQAPPATVPPVNETPVTADKLASDPVLATGRSKKARSFKLGRYEVLARIGQGGMGSVYLCRQPGHWGFQRLFTLKVIREHAAENKEAMRSFLREARIGGMLNHPNILGVVDVGNYNGQPFLVLDYVEGTSLAELLSGGQPPPAGLVIPVLLDALRGLQAAHEQTDPKGRRLGIVHCDVSPHNIMVGLDGAARITDFGSARQAAEGAPGEEDLPAVGKPGYMSPEQLCGNPLDARTDVFAMGVVMWTALTGKKLFVDPSYEQTIINVLRKKIDPPSMFGAPAALDDVCIKALSRQADGRFQSAEEMRQALHRVASREGLLASTAEISRWVKRVAGEALEQRRRLLTASNEPDGAPVQETLVPRPERPAASQDPERFRPTITIDTNDRRLRHSTPEHTSPVDSDEARELEASLRRRPLVVIAAAAVLTAAAVLGIQALVRGGRPVPPVERPTTSSSSYPTAAPGDAAPSLLSPAQTRALEYGAPQREPDPARRPGGTGSPVDIEVPSSPPGPATPARPN